VTFEGGQGGGRGGVGGRENDNRGVACLNWGTNPGYSWMIESQFHAAHT